MIDLHLHTTMSDGEHSPAAVVNMAAARGVSMLSITDHDTVDGLAEAQIAAKNAHVQFIPGIEIAVSDNRELHILGYYIDPAHQELQAFCTEIRQERSLRTDRILAYLAQHAIDLTKEQVLQYAQQNVVSRTHFALAMVGAGYVETVADAFTQYLATPAFAQIDRKKPSPAYAIRLIQQAGGVAVLAHPARLGLENHPFQHLLQQLIQAGLQGIECMYSTHTPRQTQYYQSLADQYGLLATGGSDYHGSRSKPHIHIGTGINGNLCFTDQNIAAKLWAARISSSKLRS